MGCSLGGTTDLVISGNGKGAMLHGTMLRRAGDAQLEGLEGNRKGIDLESGISVQIEDARPDTQAQSGQPIECELQDGMGSDGDIWEGIELGLNQAGLDSERVISNCLSCHPIAFEYGC